MVWWIQRQHACLRKEPGVSRICTSKERRHSIVYFVLKYCIQIFSPSRLATENSSFKAFAPSPKSKRWSNCFCGPWTPTDLCLHSISWTLQTGRPITCPVLFLGISSCHCSFCWFSFHAQDTCLPVSKKGRAENTCLKKQVTSTFTECFSCSCSAFSLFPPTPPR